MCLFMILMETGRSEDLYMYFVDNRVWFIDEVVYDEPVHDAKKVIFRYVLVSSPLKGPMLVV